MLSYLRQTQAKLVMVILLDLILLAILTIPLVVTEMPNLIYTESWNISSHPLMYSYHSIYQGFAKIQYPLLLVLIIYLFSGSRYTQMMKVLGKNKVIITQAILFTIAFPLGFLIQATTSTLLLGYSFLVFAPYFAWIVTLCGLLIYHLIFFSNIGKRDFLIQGGIYTVIAISGYLIYSTMTTIAFYYNFISINGITDQMADMTYLGQLSLQNIHYDTSTIIGYIIALFAVSFVALIENKKVGKL